MKDVLFIALEFAPIQQTGAFRSIKFVKYLREFGINPIVITIDPKDASRAFGGPINNALNDDLGYQPETYYLLDSKPVSSAESRLRKFLRVQLRLDDGFYQRLSRSLNSQIVGIFEKHNPVAVYVSLPPFGAGKLAQEIAEKFDLPLVVDMRDAWSQWGNSPFPTKFHYIRSLRDEGKLISAASSVITVTKELSEMFQRSHPDQPPSKFRVIPNGTDVKLSEDNACTWGDEEKLFKVCYVGSYYYDPRSESDVGKKWYQRRPSRWLNYRPVCQEWLYRTPYFFFSAIRRLREIDQASARKLEFHQVGATPPWLIDMAKEFGLHDQLFSHGVIPQKEVKTVLGKMDACLVTSIKVPNGKDYCLASKTFDYIDAKKMLLGFVSPGSQKNFLKSVGGIVLDPDCIEENALALKDLASRRLESVHNTSELKKYNRRQTCSELALTLNQY